MALSPLNRGTLKTQCGSIGQETTMSNQTHTTPTGGFASTAQIAEIEKLAKRAGLTINEEGIPLEAFLEAEWNNLLSREEFLVQLAAIRGYHLEYYWPSERAVTLVLPLDRTTVRTSKGAQIRNG